ncbi:MAG: DUF3570 domain-containing protein, partial [Alteromonadales bacterium]|nr:DUF3570 domain-containing protein [Alteromonadales bacterium]
MTVINKNTNVKAALSIAASALLGTSVVTTADVQANEVDEWQFDTAYLLYSEVDRVTAGEVIVAGTKTFANDEIL